MFYIKLDENNYWTGDMLVEQQFQDNEGVAIDVMPDGFLEENVIAWKSYRYEDSVLVFDEERYAILKAEHEASIEKTDTTPTVEDDLMAMAIDHEYRLTMLELFSDTAM